MQIIREPESMAEMRTAVMLGKFDGIHLGHQLLLQDMKEARAKGLAAVVFTFDRPPMSLFSDDAALPRMLLTEEEKQDYFARNDVDYYVLYPFTVKTASMEPEHFVREVLVKQLHAARIIVGTDYRFGRGRSGDVALLARLAPVYGYELEAIEQLDYQGRPISSTRVREAVAAGRMEDAAAMLGRPYVISGEIVHGKSLGRTIGFPTANLLLPETKLPPRYGVYCSVSEVEGRRYEGISNVGCRPTVQKNGPPGVETYLFGCDRELYGSGATVSLLHFLRPEQTFASVNELRTQLKEDRRNGRAYFGR